MSCGGSRLPAVDEAGNLVHSRKSMRDPSNSPVPQFCSVLTLDLFGFGMFLDDREISTGVGDTDKPYIFLVV